MEAPRIIPVAVLALSAVLLVPTFNALNEARLGDLKPPVEFDDPPPDIEPPPDTPPPTPQPPPCRNELRTLYDQAFQRPGPRTGDRAVLTVPPGTVVVGAGVRWESYRGDSSIVLTDPTGATAFNDGTTLQATVLNPRSGENGENLAAQIGDWVLTINNGGLSGAFVVGVLVQGCYAEGT